MNKLKASTSRISKFTDLIIEKKLFEKLNDNLLPLIYTSIDKNLNIDNRLNIMVYPLHSNDNQNCEVTFMIKDKQIKFNSRMVSLDEFILACDEELQLLILFNIDLFRMEDNKL